MNNSPSLESIHLAAQCWCDVDTCNIEMDSRLSIAFAKRLDEKQAKIAELTGKLVSHERLAVAGYYYTEDELEQLIKRKQAEALWEKGNAHLAKIAELEKALGLTNIELNRTIDQVNHFFACTHPANSLDEPEIWDKQTCHENQVLLKAVESKQ